MIGAMNRRITFRSWGSTQDEGGGAIATLLNTYTIWAKVEPRSGQLYSGEQQALWAYDYKITFRYEKSRVVLSNYTIDYDGKRLRINSVSFENEGNRKYVIAKCTTLDAAIDTALDLLQTIPNFWYYAIGYEDSFIADGSPLGAPPTIPVDIRNKVIVGAFKDGINFVVLIPGSTPSPLEKEVVYEPTTGQFTWSIPFEPGEVANIKFLEPC